jgi:hypothetical protein
MRVYTVKSNARRDCRKLGLNPDLVKQVRGGWAIDYPDAPSTKVAKPAKAAKAKKSPKVAKPKKEKLQKVAKQPRAKREGDPKKDRLVAMLADWTPIGDLMKALDWQAHTVRGALSTAAKALGVTIERRRVDGVTSYRVEPEAEAKAA